MQVADDECRHFLALEQRLRDMGSAYGALPAHDGWVTCWDKLGHLLLLLLRVLPCNRSVLCQCISVY